MTPVEVKEARLALRLTQAQLSRLLGYRGNNVRQMVWEIESGTKPLMPCQERLLTAYIEGYRPKDWPKTKDRG